MPAASELREPEKLVGDFPETTAFERYAAKKAKKPIWKTSTGLPRPGSLALCTLEAHEVTTNGVYRLPHAIYYCSHPMSDSPRAISGRP